MSLSPIEYLRHILDEALYLESQIEGLDKASFMRNETLKRAFVRSLEIVGEATKHISTEVRQRYGHVEWREMAGMRDRLIHGYFGIDYDLVWDVVVNKVPTLGRDIQQMIITEEEHRTQ